MNLKDRINKPNSSCIYWLCGFSLLFSIIALCGTILDESIVVNDTSIVLTFIGILATFIVVGNYSQVQTINAKFEQESKETKEYVDRTASELFKNDLNVNVVMFMAHGTAFKKMGSLCTILQKRHENEKNAANEEINNCQRDLLGTAFYFYLMALPMALSEDEQSNTLECMDLIGEVKSEFVKIALFSSFLENYEYHALIQKIQKHPQYSYIKSDFEKFLAIPEKQQTL